VGASSVTTPARVGRAVPGGPLPGGNVEVAIAAGIARHAIPLTPVVALGGLALGGFEGLYSAVAGLAIVVANVAAAARISKWAASISPGALYGAALGGYVARLGVITGVVFLLRDVVDITALGLSIVVSQLTLLIWEVRSLASHMPGTLNAEASR